MTVISSGYKAMEMIEKDSLLTAGIWSEWSPAEDWSPNWYQLVVLTARKKLNSQLKREAAKAILSIRHGHVCPEISTWERIHCFILLRAFFIIVRGFIQCHKCNREWKNEWSHGAQTVQQQSWRGPGASLGIIDPLGCALLSACQLLHWLSPAKGHNSSIQSHLSWPLCSPATAAPETSEPPPQIPPQSPPAVPCCLSYRWKVARERSEGLSVPPQHQELCPRSFSTSPHCVTSWISSFPLSIPWWSRSRTASPSLTAPNLHHQHSPLHRTSAEAQLHQSHSCNSL